jgi:hypothetical protein
MIVKKVSSKGKGSFSALAAYLLDEKNGMEKVEAYGFSHCPYEDRTENVAYIKQMQELNQMVQGDKTLHLIVSFQEEEFPSKEVLDDIEHELLKAVGLEEHYRLFVTHKNTNNFHMHIAVSKIHPHTHLIVDPYQDIPKLHKKAVELEEKYKLKKDTHPLPFEEVLKKENVHQEERDEEQSEVKKHKYRDQEIHSGMKNLLTWIQEEVLEEIKELIDTPQSDLKDLQELLAQYNLEIKSRANGLVIGDKKRKLFVKASDVHRMLSKKSLEKRFGEFKRHETSSKVAKSFGKPKSLLWESYQNLMERRKITKVDELELEKKSRLALRGSIGLKYKEQLYAIRDNPTLSSSQKYEQRQTIYAHQKAELKELSERFSNKRKEIHKTNRLFSYKEFLLERALGGDESALEALRRTKMMFKPNENILRHPQGKINHKIWESLKLQITKEGKAVYRIEGNGKIIDTGSYLKLTVEDNDRAILTSLQMAKEKFGERLDVQGSLEFKKRVMMVNERYELKISFTDKSMRRIQELGERKGMGL